MEERFEIAEAQPQLLAYHFTERARVTGNRHRQRAGERDLRQSAYAEAISHLKQGLEVPGTLPDRPECQARAEPAACADPPDGDTRLSAGWRDHLRARPCREL
jgi:hypothetical protein